MEKSRPPPPPPRPTPAISNGPSPAGETINFCQKIPYLVTVTFLKNLGCLYDTFGIHEKGTPAKKVTLREAKENVDKVCSEVQRTVASVKERFSLSRETNGPEDTVSKKTQDSLTLLRKGMNRLIEISIL